MRNYVEQAVAEIRKQVGREEVILGLSAAWDSRRRGGVAAQGHRQAAHLHLRQHGVLRAREAEVVQEVFGKHFKIKLQYEDARDYS